MSKLIAIIKKNLKLLTRSTSSSLVMILGPLILIALVGVAFNTSSLYGVKLGVYCESYNELSNSLVQSLEDNQFKIIKVNSEAECTEKIKQGSLNICLKMPANMEISNEAKNTITFYIDKSRMNLVYAILDTISDKISQRSDQLSLELTNVLLTTITSAKDELSAKKLVVAEVSSTMVDSSSKLDVINKDFSSINLTSSSLNTTTSYNSFLNSANLSEDDKESLGDVVEKMQDVIDDLNVKLNTASTKIVTANTQIQTIKQSIDTSSPKIASISTAMDSILTSINAIKVTKAENIISPITTEIKTITLEKTHLNNLIPALMLLVLMFTTLLLSSTTTVEEKLSKAYFRNFITPTPQILFMLGTFLTNVLVVLVQFAIIFGALYYFLPLAPAQIGYALVLILLCAIVFTLLGMVIGYVLNSTETTTLASITIGSLILLFSNTIMPTEALPLAIRRFVDYSSFVIGESALKKVMLFNYGLDKALFEIYVLLAYATIFFVAIILIQQSTGRLYKLTKKFTRGKESHLDINKRLHPDEKAVATKVVKDKKEVISKRGLKIEHKLNPRVFFREHKLDLHIIKKK